MIGNFSQEVGRNLPSRFTLITDHGSQGIAQWRLDRLTRMEKFAEDNNLVVTDLITQALYVIWELEQGYKWLNEQLKKPGTRSLANLTANFAHFYERPSQRYENLDHRIREAEICNRDFVPPSPPQVSDGAIHGGAGTIGAGGVAIASAFGPTAAFVAVLATAAIILIAVWYTEHRKKAVMTHAQVVVATPTAASELREAIGDMKTMQERLSAATAVYLMERQESDKLLTELKALGVRDV